MNLKEALKIVHQNGYIVIKPTEDMEEDMDKCVNCGSNGDCLSCSANICLLER
ncbi:MULTISPECIES: hypothetical protein [Clostridium]|uniref:hypothetical protein n=1 Tax=Clostridium TaxID=1485 RepID=UPI0003729F80|nr:MULTISPECIES: hypothetical protein [Clostridium]